MHRIAADLRDHYWYDELVQETLESIEGYLASKVDAAEPSSPDSLREPAA